MSARIVRVKYRAVWKQEPKLMVAIADYGQAHEVEIPLPAHFLEDDDQPTRAAEAVRGMESLAAALLDYARQTRTRWSFGPQP